MSSVPTNSSFLSSVTTVLGGQAVCAALAVVTEIFYARLLGPAGRGQISVCMMVIAFGVLLGGLGADVPAVIWSADAKSKLAEWLPATLVWGVAGCAVTAAIWVVTYWRWHPHWLSDLSPSLAAIIVATLPVTVIAAYFSAVLAGKERFHSRAAVAVVDQFGGLLGFLALLLFWGRSAESAMAGNLIGLLIGLALNVVLLGDSLRGSWRFQWPDRRIWSGLRMGVRGQLGNIASLLFYRLDVFFVNFFLGPAQVGLYALGVIVSEALWQIPSAVASALVPRTARTLEAGANEFTCSILRHVSAMSFVLGLLLAIVCPVAIPLVFGARFQPSVAVVWWILPGTVALSLAKVAGADLVGRYKNGYSSICAVVALSVSVAMDLFLVPRMGIRGAALASSAAYITDAALLLFALKYEFKVSWKTLILPSTIEFEAYRDAWLQLRSLSRPAAVPAADASESR